MTPYALCFALSALASDPAPAAPAPDPGARRFEVRGPPSAPAADASTASVLGAAPFPFAPATPEGLVEAWFDALRRRDRTALIALTEAPFAYVAASEVAGATPAACPASAATREALNALLDCVLADPVYERLGAGVPPWRAKAPAEAPPALVSELAVDLQATTFVWGRVAGPWTTRCAFAVTGASPGVRLRGVGCTLVP